MRIIKHMSWSLEGILKLYEKDSMDGLLTVEGKELNDAEARQRFDKMLTGWARHMMELQFGEHMSKINYINERCHKADILWKRMLTPAICAGIVAFIMFVCLIWVLLNIQ